MSKRRSANKSVDLGRGPLKRPKPVQLAPETVAMTHKATGFTWRISNIPASVTEEVFLRLLNDLPRSPDFPDAQPNVVRWSFAPSAASVDRDRLRTATVTLGPVPILFQVDSNSITIDLIGNREPLAIDSHFHGITPLNNPSGQPIVEYVKFLSFKLEEVV